VRAESPRVREALGRLCCDLVEDTDDRLAFVRHGGVRVLTIILRDMKDPDGALPAAMALSKLVITTPPTLLFPPPVETNALNAVAPLCMQLTHPKTKLLNQFEALMGLTNLSSIGPDVSARIATAKVRPAAESNEFRGAGTEPPSDVRVMQRVEDMMLDDNHMVRRAATELVCNLVTSAPGFRYWSGEESAVGGKPDARACSRLSVLLLLSDVDDMPTRSAAAGALATLTDSGVACVALATGGGITSSRRRTPWQRIADLFAPGGVVPPDESSSLEVISNLPPDEGLAHRGAVVVVNMASYFRENDKAQFAAAQDALAATVDRAIRAFTPPKGQKTTEEREMILEVLRVAQQELA
jgi:hypothetical protein